MQIQDFESLLKKFPQLWAVRSRWNAKHTFIKICTATKGNFLQRLESNASFEVWIQSASTGYQSMKRIPMRGKNNLATVLNAESSLLSNAVQRVYVVRQLRRKEIDVCIIEPPKGQKYVDFIRSIGQDCTLQL